MTIMSFFKCLRVCAGVALLLVALVGPSYGQVNIENKRMTRDESGIGGSVGLSIELERGNSELTEIITKPQVVVRSGASQWFLLNEYSFTEAGRTTVINEGFSHLRYNYNVTDRVAAEALTQFQYNREQDLQIRSLLGAGLRFELIERERSSLAVGVTGMYEYEELVTGSIIRTARNSDYVAIRVKLRQHLTLSNTIYLQPAFDDVGDIRVLDDLELSVAISKWLAITLEVKYRYDSEPPAGVKEYDLSLKNGLTVSF